uniref:ATS domain-containing protein n=1 Tax=Strongyloides papillosus TaxID=174720 RepID=A0A0N5BK00_STREA
MISPVNDHYITLNDIKRSKIGHKFYNIFININKFIEQELTDGELPQSCDDTDVDIVEWDNFCSKYYEMITDENDDSFNCGDEEEHLNFSEIDSDNSTNGD